MITTRSGTYVNTREAAERLGCSRYTVYKFVERGKLAQFRREGTRGCWYRLDEVEALLEPRCVCPPIYHYGRTELHRLGGGLYESAFVVEEDSAAKDNHGTAAVRLRHQFNAISDADAIEQHERWADEL
jgi:excisionase family DNA binding protein